MVMVGAGPFRQTTESEIEMEQLLWAVVTVVAPEKTTANKTKQHRMAYDTVLKYQFKVNHCLDIILVGLNCI